MKQLASSAFVAVSVMVTILTAQPLAAQIYRGETADAGNPAHSAFVAFANSARNSDMEIEVNAGQTLSKSMLTAAQGQIQFYSGVPSLYTAMQERAGVFAEIDGVEAAAGKLRSIFGFQAGAYHPVVLASSGIENWADLKGKSIFVGPPASSAAEASEILIRGAAGLEPGEDYKPVLLSWGEGVSALSDGNVDMIVRPAEVGSAVVQQFGVNGEFRVLSIPGEAMEGEVLTDLFERAGRGVVAFDGSVYDGQLTEGEINALGFFQFVGTNEDVPEDVVYEVTKAFWDNLDEVHASAAFLKSVTPETAFVSVNVPLHPGAYRYYQEAGFDVPEELIPQD